MALEFEGGFEPFEEDNQEFGRNMGEALGKQYTSEKGAGEEEPSGTVNTDALMKSYQSQNPISKYIPDMNMPNNNYNYKTPMSFANKQTFKDGKTSLASQYGISQPDLDRRDVSDYHTSQGVNVPQSNALSRAMFKTQETKARKKAKLKETLNEVKDFALNEVVKKIPFSGIAQKILFPKHPSAHDAIDSFIKMGSSAIDTAMHNMFGNKKQKARFQPIQPISGYHQELPSESINVPQYRDGKTDGDGYRGDWRDKQMIKDFRNRHKMNALHEAMMKRHHDLKYGNITGTQAPGPEEMDQSQKEIDNLNKLQAMEKRMTQFVMGRYAEPGNFPEYEQGGFVEDREYQDGTTDYGYGYDDVSVERDPGKQRMMDKWAKNWGKTEGWETEDEFAQEHKERREFPELYKDPSEYAQFENRLQRPSYGNVSFEEMQKSKGIKSESEQSEMGWGDWMKYKYKHNPISDVFANRQPQQRPTWGGQMRKHGGTINGPSHEEGGVDINVEGGEVIVPAYASSSVKAKASALVKQARAEYYGNQ